MYTLQTDPLRLKHLKLVYCVPLSQTIVEFAGMRKSAALAKAEKPGGPNLIVMSCVALMAKIVFQPRVCSTVLAPEVKPLMTVAVV
jgi:hypothetical protein